MKQQELAPVKPSREKGALNFIHYDETTTRCSGSPCVGGQDLGAGEIESPRRRGVASAPRSPPRHENRGRGSHRARPRSSNARSDNLLYINGLRVPRQKLASPQAGIVSARNRRRSAPRQKLARNVKRCFLTFFYASRFVTFLVSRRRVGIPPPSSPTGEVSDRRGSRFHDSQCFLRLQ